MNEERDRLLAGWEAAARTGALTLEAIGRPEFAAIAHGQAEGYRSLRGLGTRGVGGQSPSPMMEQSPGAARAEPLAPSPPPEVRGSLIRHLGGPRDGDVASVPDRCPCCAERLRSGTILRYRDGSRYLLDLNAGRALYVTPALLGSGGAA